MARTPDETPSETPAESADASTDAETVEAEIVEEPAPAKEEPAELVVDEDGTVSEVSASGTGTIPGTEQPGGERVVYVTAPIPPKRRSNRLVGALLALVGTAVFGAVYALTAAVIAAVLFSDDFFGPVFGSFLSDAAFWIPILFFALGFVGLTVLLNRASWWLHVLTSLLVAVIVYFGMIGMLLLVNGAVGSESAGALFGQIAAAPYTIAAALVAREVSIWVGFLIAARGQRLRRRNAETRAAWDEEQAQKQAEKGETVGASAS